VLSKDGLDLAIVNTELPLESRDDKLGILDVRAKTQEGKIINIEIQIVKSTAFFERITFYKSKLIASQIGRGDWYDRIKKTICIVITDFNLIENSAPERYHHVYRLHDPADGTYFGDVEEVHVFELTRLPAIPDGTSVWEWVLFIKAREEKELKMVKERNADIGRAVDELYRVSGNDEVRQLYELRERAWMDEQARLDYSLKEGLRQGMQQGMRQGLLQGRQEGRQEGKLEGLFETAGALKKMGLSDEQIALATGLPPEQIAGL
jgi:predicted transposase/invertase (TIGR01784 family)